MKKLNPQISKTSQTQITESSATTLTKNPKAENELEKRFDE